MDREKLISSIVSIAEKDPGFDRTIVEPMLARAFPPNILVAFVTPEVVQSSNEDLILADAAAITSDAWFVAVSTYAKRISSARLLLSQVQYVEREFSEHFYDLTLGLPGVIRFYTVRASKSQWDELDSLVQALVQKMRG